MSGAQNTASGAALRRKVMTAADFLRCKVRSMLDDEFMRVAIIGSGVAGSAAAIFLQRAGHTCEVFERAERGGDGIALVMSSNGQAVLQAAGVGDAVRAASLPIDRWSFENEQGRVLAAPKDARFGSEFQTRAIPRGVLQRILEAQAVAEGAKIAYGKKLVAVRDGLLLFEDGSAAEFDCLIGADGIGSTVRACVMPEMAKPRYTGLFAPGGISAAREQRDAACHFMYGRGGFFEYLDVMTDAGPRVLWWSTASAELMKRTDMAAMTLEMWRARLLELHKGWGPQVARILNSTEVLVPLFVHSFDRLATWHRGNVLLIGDAAHAVGPHSGQSSAMALEDAQALGRVMRGVTAASVADAFVQFEQERMPRVDRVVELGARSEGRKQVMTKWRYWWMQQELRVRVPIGSRKPRGWLLDYRVGGGAEG